MTYSSRTIELIAQLADTPKVYQKQDRVPFARCLVLVTQTRVEDNDWVTVSDPYQRVVLVYRRLVALFKSLKPGDVLHLRCKESSQLQTDEAGMSIEVNQWIVSGVKSLDDQAAHRVVDQAIANKRLSQVVTNTVTTRDKVAIA